MSRWTKFRDSVTGSVGTVIDPVGSIAGRAIGAGAEALGASPQVAGLLGVAGAPTLGSQVNLGQDLLTGQFAGGGGGGAPSPDASAYTSAADRDWAMNQWALQQQTFANRPTVNTPFGTQYWEAGETIDPATGKKVTTWTQNTKLTPEQQQALDAQQRIGAGRSGAAETLLGQATGAFGKPFDWDNLPPEQRQAAQAGNVGQAQNAAYEQMRQMLQPGREQQQSSLDTKLANMGLAGGSEANRRANMQLSDQWAQQDRQMLGQAMQQGLQNVQGQFGLDTQQIAQAQALRQAAIAEQAQQRGMPLNELNALLSGQQVSMPQMPGFNAAGFGQPSQQLAAQQAAGQYQLGAEANRIAQQPNWGSLVGGVGGLIGGLAML